MASRSPLPVGTLPVIDHEIAVWSLVGLIEELETERDELKSELAEVRRSRGPVAGGPPREWDRWIMAIPDAEFAELLSGRRLLLEEREVAQSAASVGRYPPAAPTPARPGPPSAAQSWHTPRRVFQ